MHIIADLFLKKNSKLQINFLFVMKLKDKKWSVWLVVWYLTQSPTHSTPFPSHNLPPNGVFIL